MKSEFKVLLYLLLALPFTSFGQNSSNKGTDFWVGFPAHGDGTRADMYFYITADSNTSGTVSIPGQSWSTNFTVSANQMTLVSVPNNRAYVSCTDCIEEKGIHVVSSKKVVVYSHIYYQYRSDATLVLPTPTTGKEYFIMSYDQYGPSSDRSQFMIVANQDDTKVNITPTVDLGGGRAKDKTYQITLDEGEVYQGRASGRSADVTGTHIEVIDTGSNASCRTVALFSGSSNCFLGCSPTGSGGFPSYDNLYQQLYPTKSWGTRYVTIPFKGRKDDNVRILAMEDNTSIVINKTSGAPVVRTLDRGESWDEYDISTSLYILASKPISVAQFQKSQKCGGKGDPSMTILNPIEQTLKQITVYSSEYEDIDDHYINVIIPNAGVSSFRIDGATASFTKVPKLQSYSYAQITVSKGNHKLVSDYGFIAIAYGFGNYESYGYAAGANVKDLTAKLELVNSAQAQNDINSICLGTEAEFEGQAEYSVSKWIWDFGDGTKDTGQFVFHTYKDTGNFQVWLYTHKVNFDGCSSYDSAELGIRVNMPPTANFVTGKRCEANSVVFTDSSKAPRGESILSRQWIFHNGSTYATNTTRYYDTAGVYKVSLISKTDAQCTDTMTIDMVVNPNPVADISINDLCFKDSAHFVNSSTIKTGGIDSAIWYFGDGDSAMEVNPVHFYNDSGSYYISMTAFSDSGCFNSTMDTVFKYPVFTLDFTHKDTCVGLGVDFTNTSSVSVGTLDDWLWKFPGGTEFSTTNASYNFSSAGTYVVTLLGTQDNYCRDSVQKNVVVDPLVSADFKFSGKCLNDPVNFINTSTLANGTISKVSWDFDDGISGSKDTVDVNYTSNGTKTVELIALSNAGCADTISKQITIYDPKITNFIKPVVCEGQSAKLWANTVLDSDTILSYAWDVDGFTSNKDTLSFTPATVGKYHVELEIQTAKGCTLFKIDSFDVYALPIANFTVSDICEGYNIVPVNSSSISNGETISQYNWNFNGNAASTVRNPSILATPTGTATISLEVISTRGCRDYLEKNLEIFAVPRATFIYSDTCLTDVTSINSTASISSGTVSSYLWSYNDGITDAGKSIVRVLPNDGAYTLKHVVISDNGCRDSITRNFNIAPNPQLDITVVPLTGCVPLRVTPTNNSTINSGSITTYEWNWGDGTNATGISPSKVYDVDGSYQIEVYATSNANCKDTLMLSNMVDVKPSPTADFSYLPLEPSLLFPDVNFINESSPDATSFFWSTGDGQTYSSPNVDHTFAEAGDYDVILIATSDNGCKDTSEQLLNVKLDFFIWIPTVFSPNGDFINDVFRVNGVFSEVIGYEIKIFNRWGEVIFSSDNTGEVWDGTYLGTEVPAGSYGYHVRYINYETGRWESRMGSIKLIR